MNCYNFSQDSLDVRCTCHQDSLVVHQGRLGWQALPAASPNSLPLHLQNTAKYDKIFDAMSFHIISYYIYVMFIDFTLHV